ncbi:MAG TPA: FHA domain-containing protein [Thermoanaerobaculia bacterium]|nr:FHA domain-containing protein [Thermoanaerobaculia bacterium]
MGRARIQPHGAWSFNTILTMRNWAGSVGATIVHRASSSFEWRDRGDVAAAAAFIIFKDRQLPLREGLNVLGRDPIADVQIDDSTVSRKHASIEVRGELATLRDLESKNGTFLDGEKISAPAPLQERQTIVFGDASMVFRRSAFASTLAVAR